MWRCWVVLMSFGTTVVMSYSTCNSLKSTEFLSRHRWWLVEKAEVRMHTGFVLSSQTANWSIRRTCDNIQECYKANYWLTSICLRFWWASQKSPFNRFRLLLKKKKCGRLCDLFKYFYCCIRKLVPSASPSGKPALLQHLATAMDFTLSTSTDFYMMQDD